MPGHHNHFIGIVANGLLLLGCVVGGVVSATVALMIVAASVLDLRDLNQVPEFLAVTSHKVQLLGATVGALIYVRHRAQGSGAAAKQTSPWKLAEHEKHRSP